MRLTDADKCYILAALERCQAVPETVLERCQASLGRDRPWAPYGSLQAWFQARLEQD